MRIVTDRRRNPFGMDLPCASAVPSYGDANADFHVIGDHPGVHGGLDAGIPFMGRRWSEHFFDALDRAGLVEAFDAGVGTLAVDRTFLSYLYPCDPNDGRPEASDYADLEPFSDAELRAITADVLVPVGVRATEHVLAAYTARDLSLAADLDAIHGTELTGSGWLVVPVTDPAAWQAGDAERLADGLLELQRTDYRRTADLGRFGVGDEPYFVR